MSDKNYIVTRKTRSGRYVVGAYSSPQKALKIASQEAKEGRAYGQITTIVEYKIKSGSQLVATCVTAEKRRAKRRFGSKTLFAKCEVNPTFVEMRKAKGIAGVSFKANQGLGGPDPSRKIFATSISRYSGGVREKRAYGGAGTITVFYVGYEGSEPLSWLKIEGHGASPSARKADAIRQFNQKHG